MCTRVLWNDNGLAVVAGRTMDWPESTEPILTALPRGLQHDGGAFGPGRPWRRTRCSGPPGSAAWSRRSTARQPRTGSTSTDSPPTCCTSRPATSGRAMPSRPGLHAGLWAQYVLDNAATVERGARRARRGAARAWSRRTADRRRCISHSRTRAATRPSSSSSEGSAVVHHGREFTGHDERSDLRRAARAARRARLLAAPAATCRCRATSTPATASSAPRTTPRCCRSPRASARRSPGVLAIARNVSVPFGAPYGEFGIYNTEYRTVCRRDEPPLLLRAHDEPERGLGRSRRVRPRRRCSCRNARPGRRHALRRRVGRVSRGARRRIDRGSVNRRRPGREAAAGRDEPSDRGVRGRR